jgi:hypothetical protein
VSTLAEVDEAIRVIEHSRSTHQQWLDWLALGVTRCGTPGCDRDHSRDAEVAGDEQHQRQAIAGYDKVLAVLRDHRVMLASTVTIDDAVPA